MNAHLYSYFNKSPVLFDSGYVDLLAIVYAW